MTGENSLTDREKIRRILLTYVFCRSRYTACDVAEDITKKCYNLGGVEIPLLPLESLSFIIPIVIILLSIIPFGIILLIIYAESKYSYVCPGSGIA